VEGDVGNQVQEKYADLEDRHPGVDHAFRKKSIPLFSFPQRLERNAVVERLERAAVLYSARIWDVAPSTKKAQKI